MHGIRIMLLFLFIAASIIVDAQVIGRGSLTELKRNLIGSTFELTQIRNRLNEKVKDTVTNKRLYFTKDSIFLTSENTKMAGVWLNGGIAFVLFAENGTKLKFKWLVGDENNFCFTINDNRDSLQCYRKVR